MARRFFFKPDVFSVPTIGALKQQWMYIPDEEAKTAIATQHQYYFFHRYSITAIRHENPDKEGQGFEQELGLSIRLGAIKAGRLLTGSIVEAALRSHADLREIKIGGGDKKTLGKILTAWENSAYKKEVEEILVLARKLHRARNDVHLYKNAMKERNILRFLSFESLIHSEDDKLIDLLQKFISYPF